LVVDNFEAIGENAYEAGKARWKLFGLLETGENVGLAGVIRGMDGTVEVEMSREGEIAVAAFKSGCISDVDGIATTGRRIRAFVEDSAPKMLVFDFSEVRFFSSQVLGLLLDLRARLQKNEGEVVISGINPQLYRVFKITNLDKIFRFFEDRDSAVKTMSSD